MGQGSGVVARAEDLPAGGHRAAGDQQDLMAGIGQGGDLRGQGGDHGGVQAAAGAGEHRAAHLDDYPPGLGKDVPAAFVPVAVGHGPSS